MVSGSLSMTQVPASAEFCAHAKGPKPQTAGTPAKLALPENMAKLSQKRKGK